MTVTHHMYWLSVLPHNCCCLAFMSKQCITTVQRLQSSSISQLFWKASTVCTICSTCKNTILLQLLKQRERCKKNCPYKPQSCNASTLDTPSLSPHVVQGQPTDPHVHPFLRRPGTVVNSRNRNMTNTRL